MLMSKEEEVVAAAETTEEKPIQEEVETGEKFITMDGFRDEISKVGKVLVALVFGPALSGKSTFLNLLTVKGYPFLNKRGNVSKEAKEMMHFKVKDGSGPHVSEFRYKHMKASEFMSVHNLNESDIKLDDDYDIFFIDSEGFGNITNISDNLFVNLFSLIGGTDILIYFDKTPMTNADRVKNIAQSITVTRILEIEPPKLFSIARDGSCADDDDDDDDDDDENNVKYNEKMYKNLRKQDFNSKNVFINTLKGESIINVHDDENNNDKIDVLTLPKCSEMEGFAYKKLMCDFSKMILNSEVRYDGCDILKRIDYSYNKICLFKAILINQTSISVVYSNVLKEFCQKTIDELKDTLGNNVKPAILYNHLEEKLLQVIPSINVLDDITKEYLESIKRGSSLRIENVKETKKEEKMEIEEDDEKEEKEEENQIPKLVKKITDNREYIYRLYEANDYLYVQKPSSIISVTSIDDCGNPVNEKRMTVFVSNEEFEYEGKKLYYVIPNEIKVNKIKNTTVRLYKLGFYSNEQENKINSDITSEYHFDFINLTLSPRKVNDKNTTESTYKYTIYNKDFFYFEETVVETIIKVTVHDKCEYETNKYVLMKQDWASEDKQGEMIDLTIDAKAKSVNFKAKPHEIHRRTNILRIKSVEFVKKK